MGGGSQTPVSHEENGLACQSNFLDLGLSGGKCNHANMVKQSHTSLILFLLGRTHILGVLGETVSWIEWAGSRSTRVVGVCS